MTTNPIVWFQFGSNEPSQAICDAAIARSPRYILIQPWWTTTAAYFKAHFPECKVLGYKDLMSARADAASLGNNGPCGVTYAQASANGWLTGTVMSGYTDQSVTKTWDSGYQHAWTTNVLQWLTDNPNFDGIFADNLVSPQNDYYDTGQNESQLANGCLAIVQLCGPQMVARGKLMMPNITDGRLVAGWWTAGATPGGAACDEMSFVWPGGAYNTDPASQIAEGAAPGAFIARTNGADHKSALYGFGCFLLSGEAQNGGAYYSCDFNQYNVPLIWYDEYALGTQLGNTTTSLASNAGVLSRQFENGIVYVNTNSGAVSVTLPGTLHQVDGSTVSGSYTIAGTSAAVLVGTLGVTPPPPVITGNQLTSREQQGQDWAPTNGTYAYSSSTTVPGAGVVGAALLTGVSSAALGPNLLSANQAGIDTDISGWSANFNCNLARVTANYRTAPACLQATTLAGGPGVCNWQIATQPAVTVGNDYTFQAWVRLASTTGKLGRLKLQYADASFSDVGAGFVSADVTLTTGYQLLTVHGVAPTGATMAFLVAEAETTVTAELVLADDMYFGLTNSAAITAQLATIAFHTVTVGLETPLGGVFDNMSDINVDVDIRLKFYNSSGVYMTGVDQPTPLIAVTVEPGGSYSYSDTAIPPAGAATCLVVAEFTSSDGSSINGKTVALSGAFLGGTPGGGGGGGGGTVDASGTFSSIPGSLATRPSFLVPSIVSVVSTLTTGLPKVLPLTPFAGATAPMDELVYRIEGPISSPGVQFLSDIDGSVIESFTYGVNLADGESITIDAGQWTLTGGGGHVADPSKILYTGSRFLTVGHSKPGTAPTVRLTGSAGGDNTRLTVSGRAQYISA